MPVAATIHHGALPIILSGPRPSKAPRGVLDTLSYELLTSAGNWETDAAALGFEYENTVPDYSAMFVQAMQQEEENNLVATVSVSCIGLLTPGDDKRKRRLSVAGREVAVGPTEKVVLAWTSEETGTETDGTPLDQVKRRVPKLDEDGEVVYKIIATPSGTADRWNVREAILVVTDVYFTTTRPASNLGGTVLPPPNPPEAPPYIWGGYDEPLRANHPNGWVLDDRQIEEYFSNFDDTGLWEVTDTHGYYYIYTPD